MVLFEFIMMVLFCVVVFFSRCLGLVIIVVRLLLIV